MAYLSSKEFERAVQLLTDEYGLQRLRDKLFKMRGLITRRGFKSPESLAQQLFSLSSGLRREVPSSFAFQAIWTQNINSKVGEDAEEQFEKLADAVNVCLDDGDNVADGKTDELTVALGAYESSLAASVGAEIARIDMLMKAVPAVADLLRAAPLVDQSAASEEPAAAGAEEAATASETVEDSQ